MLQIVDILCPEKESLFSNLALSANTVAERINGLSRNICEQLWDKARSFTAFSVVLDESTDATDNAQLAIFIRGVDDRFKVTEELLSLC